MIQNSGGRGQEVDEMNIVQTSGIDLKLDFALVMYRNDIVF